MFAERLHDEGGMFGGVYFEIYSAKEPSCSRSVGIEASLNIAAANQATSEYFVVQVLSLDHFFSSQ